VNVADTSDYVSDTRLLIVGILSGLVAGIAISLLYFSLITEQSTQWSNGIATRVIELQRDLNNVQQQKKEVLGKLEEKRSQISLLQQNLEIKDAAIQDLEEKLGRNEQFQETALDHNQQVSNGAEQRVDQLHDRLAIANTKIQALEEENRKLKVRTYFQYDQ
jgi:chromosome segregation ATPase